MAAGDHGTASRVSPSRSIVWPGLMPLRLRSERVKVLRLCQINYHVGCRFLHERLSFCRLRTVQSIVLSSLTMEAALAWATHLAVGRFNYYIAPDARKAGQTEV